MHQSQDSYPRWLWLFNNKVSLDGACTVIKSVAPFTLATLLSHLALPVLSFKSSASGPRTNEFSLPGPQLLREQTTAQTGNWFRTFDSPFPWITSKDPSQSSHLDLSFYPQVANAHGKSSKTLAFSTILIKMHTWISRDVDYHRIFTLLTLSMRKRLCTP